MTIIIYTFSYNKYFSAGVCLYHPLVEKYFAFNRSWMISNVIKIERYKIIFFLKKLGQIIILLKDK
jgi:hypothetical protein